MRVIGLTGGIASGKSTVAGILEKLGAKVVDADQLSREAVMPCNPAYHAIVAAFGAGILNPDRTIDRKELGKIVFADPEARKRLEEITHPAIRALAEEMLEELRRGGAGIAFYMAPLLIESGGTSRVDEVWVVYADRETQIERLVGRDLISRAEALQRLAAQMPMEEKKRHGRVVIDNRGTPEELEQQVRKIWERELKSPE
ncbi:MAG: dephospho-CoA kinase [Geobacteraceae bacterium]|nr:dephospho-CoA kinase [Geobacteraceae bacterium]